MEPCKNGHIPPINYFINEIVGPVAQLRLVHTYESTYPDYCLASRRGKYSLSVRGQYIQSWTYEGGSGFDVPPMLKILQEIATKMNE